MSSDDAREALVNSIKDQLLLQVLPKLEVRTQLAKNLQKMKQVAKEKLDDREVDSAFTNPEVEATLFQALQEALQDFDPEAFVAQAENAMSSDDAREALVHSIKDQLLLQVLPKLEVRTQLATNLQKMKQVAKEKLAKQQQDDDTGVASAFTNPELFQALQ